MTLLLALSGRGFAEVGTKGLKVAQVVMRSEASLRQQRQVDEQTRAILSEFDDHMEVMQAELEACQHRLEILEARR